ncbi:MAG: sigma 54-interacting transcriptional regulator [Oscillospiraceae bacterium]|nr:sigma 54-interacting transcriptional regulator [Oscillospiraceae bacterium]MDY6095000.1 sigma 54-interacting transcriptional regulator [Oscillospiraceae bacterium]
MYTEENERIYWEARKRFLLDGTVSDAVDPGIAASWRRSAAYGVDAKATVLYHDRNMNVLTNGIELLNTRDAYFYLAEAELLSSIGAAIVFTDDHFDVFAIRGNRELKDELRAMNFRFGTNLAESNVGTTALSMSFFSGQEVWVCGSEHYMRALTKYICVANCSQANFKSTSGVLYPSMIIIPIEKYQEQYRFLFSYILSTHMYRQRSLMNSNYLIYNSIINLMTEMNAIHYIALDNDNRIIDLSDGLLNQLSLQYAHVIGSELRTVFPCLAQTMEEGKLGDSVKMTGCTNIMSPKLGSYYARCVEIRNDGDRIGKVVLMSSVPLGMKALPTGNHIPATETDAVERVQMQPQAPHRSAFSAKYTFNDLCGSCQAFNEAVYRAQRVAKSDSSVLILGESGTGKELFAQAIHNASSRRGHPFVSINCAAMPRELISSELFGYVEGAFTGARKNGAPGKIELANKGTLFLDEIGDMPLDLQVHLLKVLEDKAFTRLGDSKSKTVDIRVIAATNQDLNKLVREGAFRLDLYYRLNVFTLELPPLRGRVSDIPQLTRLFIKQCAQRLDKQVSDISPEALGAFMAYSWPGNLRELRNAVESSVNLAMNEEIMLSDIPTAILRATGIQPENAASNSLLLTELNSAGKRAETEMILELMERYNGNKSMVAEKLGISRPALYRKLKKIQGD